MVEGNVPQFTANHLNFLESKSHCLCIHNPLKAKDLYKNLRQIFQEAFKAKQKYRLTRNILFVCFMLIYRIQPYGTRHSSSVTRQYTSEDIRNKMYRDVLVHDHIKFAFSNLNDHIKWFNYPPHLCRIPGSILSFVCEYITKYDCGNYNCFYPQ